MDKKINTAQRDSSLRNKAEEKLPPQPGDNGSLQEEMNDKRLLHELQVHQIELEMQKDELLQAQADLRAERSLKNDLVTWLAQTSSRDTGEPFFNKLARYLAKHLEMDFVCIDRLEGDRLTARTLAVWCDGHFEDNVTYALKDTPCGEVVGKHLCCFPAMVSQLFPDDQVLQELRAESYVGVTLLGHTGSPIGLIAVISRRPLVNRRQAETLMQLVAERAAAELERMIVDEALRDREFELEEAQLLADTGSWTYDPVIRKAMWSKGMFHIWGLDPALGMFSVEEQRKYIHPDDYPQFAAGLKEAVEQGKPYSMEMRIIRPDGSERTVITICEPQRDASGKVVKLRGSNQDITERKRAEQEKRALELQLQHAQKLESLGVLAGGIAHDFNNILAIIVGHCSLAKWNPDRAEKSIPVIEQAAQRAAGLCRQMLAYAGKAQFVQSRFDLGGLVDEMVKMLKSSLPRNAAIKLDIPAEMPFISGDVGQIRQVVMNLIINASEAIGESQGEIRISLTKTEIGTGQPAKDHLGKAIAPGWYNCLEVTDNGCGMDDETISRIFEPFYTTKFTGRGLGMSAVLGIINSHGGALQLFSQPGQGTTFKVYLPVQISGEPEGDKSPDQEAVETWQGSGTILLVEDEESIMSIAQSMLEMLGFRVVGACNGKEALALYRKNAVNIDLVITDIGMPVMDGYALFRELKELNPELPIIISSGLGDTMVTSKIPVDAIAGMIGKPYNLDQLRKTLKRVVEGM